MAKILQPEKVIRFDPEDFWNKTFNRTFKWHLRLKTKTACGEILEERPTQLADFCTIDPKDLCGFCFRGLEIVND